MARADLRRLLPPLAALAALACTAGSRAETMPAPLLTPKPIFVPGMYETESRNSAFQDQPAKGRVCLKSADFDAFRQETMDQYRASPQFMKTCKLSDTKALPDGFAFAMDCKADKIILTYHFHKDLVSGTIETLILARPEYSSSILTLMRRVGDCPGQVPGRAL